MFFLISSGFNLVSSLDIMSLYQCRSFTAPPRPVLNYDTRPKRSMRSCHSLNIVCGSESDNSAVVFVLELSVACAL